DDDDDKQTFEKNPSISITKTVTTEKDDLTLDNDLNFEIVVTNTGNVTLTNIIVEDQKVGLSTLVETLGVDESVTFTPSVVITQQMIDDKCYVNTATASVVEFLIDARIQVQTPDGGSIQTYDGMAYRVLFSDEASAEACFTQGPALTIDKTILGKDTYEAVDDVITYQYIVTNSGNVTLEGPFQVVDDKIASIPSIVGALGVGESFTTTASYTVVAADITNLTVTNVAYATTEFGEEEIKSNNDSETANAIVLILDEIDTYCELDAPYIKWDLRGINLQLLGQNLGPNPVTMVWIDKNGNEIIRYENLPFEGFMLFPGAEVDENGYGTQWPGWKFENMQWVSGDFNFAAVRDGASVRFEINPEVTSEVSYPGATEACNPNPNPPIAVDDDMTAIPVYPDLGFTNIVNVLDNDKLGDITGLNTTLVDIFVVDQSTPGALILDPSTGLVSVATGLAPGIYTLEYRICTNPNPTNCDTAIVTVRVVSPGVDVEKTVIDNDNEVDGFITYEIKVTNIGDVELFNIEVKDDLTGDSWTIQSLAPLATWTETTQLPIDQELLDGRCVTNTASAVVYLEPYRESESEEEFIRTVLVSDEDSIEACFEQNPAIELLKDGVFNDENEDGFGNAGETISYTFTVTNTGNVTLSGITIEDDKVTVVGGPIASLVPGATDNTTFTATYTLTQEDVDAGYVVNTALARGEAPGGNPEDPSDDITDESSDPTPVEVPSTECETCTETEIPQNPAIELLKDGVFNDENEDGFGNAGETISYTFTVTNTGNVTLSGITIEDDKVTVVGGPIASLVPGATDNTTFTATYTLTQEDVDAGYVVNTALARGEAPGGNPEDPSDDITDESSDPTPVEVPSTECETCTETEIPQNPDIQIVKSDNGAQVSKAGDVITYTLTVTNTGNVTLTNVQVNDPLTGLATSVGTLAPAATAVVNTTYTVTQADVDKGSVLNKGLTSGDSPDEETPTDEDDEETPIERNPSIQIVKSDNGAQVSKAGDVITYTLTVTNTGNVTLTNVQVNDPLTGLATSVGTLAPAATAVVNTTYTVAQADVDKGSVLNKGLTSGDSPDEETPTDEDDEETPIERNPSIQIVKSDNGAQVSKAGDVITYTLTVTNTGNVTLTNVQVNDPLTGLATSVGTLAPAANAVVNTTYTV
ncbi:DUF7507 domain-containing protein, partial [Algoriphagus litoralis]